jgi:hypothetical protein
LIRRKFQRAERNEGAGERQGTGQIYAAIQESATTRPSVFVHGNFLCASADEKVFCNLVIDINQSARNDSIDTDFNAWRQNAESIYGLHSFCKEWHGSFQINHEMPGMTEYLCMVGITNRVSLSCLWRFEPQLTLSDEDVNHRGKFLRSNTSSEQRINKRCQWRCRREDQKHPEQQQNHHEGNEPPFLLLSEKKQKLFEDLPHVRGISNRGLPAAASYSAISSITSFACPICRPARQ